MYFMYVDETYERRTKYLVLGCFILNEEDWGNLNYRVKCLKKKYFNDEILNLKKIRRQKYDEDENYSSLTNESREKFNKEFYELLSSPEYTYMACLIDKEKMENSDKKFIFRMAYSFLIQRFQFFLQEKNQRGMIIMDESKSPEIVELFEYHKECLEKGVPFKKETSKFKLGDQEIEVQGHKYMNLSNIVEHLLFLDDDHSNHLQVADMISSAISYNFNRNNDFYYKKIINNMRKSHKNGQIEGYGLKFFPQ